MKTVNEFFDQLHAEKYRAPGEDFREAMNRIANALKDSDEHFYGFRSALMSRRFLPGGRVQSAMGSVRQVTAYNCYVSGTIEDSFVDGYGSIMHRAVEAAATMRMGGGIGYDFSALRPKGALIKKLQSRSSGPVSFMHIYDAVGVATSSSGHRRGAQMGVLRIDHPDIEEFIHAKQNRDRLTSFNISIAVTDEFMKCLELQRPFRLRWGGETYREVDPAALWDQVMRSTWDWAEPGILFIDRINETNNLNYCEKISATNPCGEQPLPPYGACLLGSFNLASYIRGVRSTEVPYLDVELLAQDIPHVVRAMDNVVDRTIYPLYEQKKEAKQKRRMGLGITGLANAGEMLGHRYGSQGFVGWQRAVMRLLAHHVYAASVKLAAEKGPFPLYDARYCASDFIRTLPPDLRESILRNGIRNSHLLSVAPTGTISLTAGNVSSGVEPVFARSVKRQVRGADGTYEVNLQDYALREWGLECTEAVQVTPQEHLAVLAAATGCVDSNVSKTVNVPADARWEDFKDLYTLAWAQGCKGLTTYKVGGKREGILSEDESASCRIDSTTGRRECE